MPTLAAIKILHADDHSLFRDGLRHVLRRLAPGAEILDAGSGHETLAVCNHNPDLDLVLLDLSLPDIGGVEVLARLHARHPDMPVVVLSESEQLADIMAAIAAGARGYIPKSASSKVLFAALRLVFDGAVYVPPVAFGSPGTTAEARPEIQPPAPHTTDGTAGNLAALGLTARQQAVLQLIVEGKSNKHIARELGIEESTVKVHVSPVLKALQVTNRVQAVLAVSRLGIRFGRLNLEQRRAAANRQPHLETLPDGE